MKVRNHNDLRDEATTVSPRHFDPLRNAARAEDREETLRVAAPELTRVFDAIEEPDATRVPDEQEDFTRHLTDVDAVEAVMEIAHDMRSPLTSILFLVDTLRRGRSGPLTPVQERQLGLIYGAALGLNTLASDVIDAVRGGQRLVDGRPIPFSIAEVILGVCDTVRPISEEKNIEIRQELMSVDGRVGYPVALGRVLLNLMTNALKYTREGSVTVGCAEQTAERVLFWVEDTGEGIPSHVMPMLFDSFRPGAAGTRFSNAGLGLAMCKSFLSAMGSTLELDSVMQRGTRFSFVLELPRA
jgi:signal transduction histidine kinase